MKFSVKHPETGLEVYSYKADAQLELGEPFAGYPQQVVPNDPVQVEDTRIYGGRRKLTKLEFWRLLSAQEEDNVMDFNDYYFQHPALTDEQKKAIRRGLKKYDLAEEIDLDDPDTQGVVALYEAVGVIGPGRSAEILNG